MKTFSSVIGDISEGNNHLPCKSEFSEWHAIKESVFFKKKQKMLLMNVK